jgi:predicted ABC-type ATPase
VREGGRRAPSVVVLAGPNGAGKTTASRHLLQGALAVHEFVNADAIARGLSGFDPDRAAIEAGRVMLARLRDLAVRRVDFAFETTLASRSFAPWLRRLAGDGYRFHLCFLWLPSSQLAVSRVERRVAQGGHTVPAETIVRRYDAGIRNFFALYRPIADSWQVLDGVNGARCIAAGNGNSTTLVADPGQWSMILAHDPAR